MVTQRSFVRVTLSVATAMSCGATALAAQQNCPAVQRGNMPLKYQGGATVPAITPCDLMARLYIYADDSMMGREAGTPNNIRATAYIEGQVRKFGLKPGGDNGTFFQYLPVFNRSFDSTSTITVAGEAFRGGTDFSVAGGIDRTVEGSVIFGGAANDTTGVLPADVVRGKILVVMAAAGGQGGRGGFGGRGRGPASSAQQAYQQMAAAAAAVVTVAGDQLNAGGRGGFGGGRGGATFVDTVQAAGRAAFAAANPAAASGRGGFGGGGVNVTVTTRVAAAMLGKSLAQAVKGDIGKPASIDVRFKQVDAPTRNVIAILPGSDPKLRGEYIVIGAHSDHNGPAQRPVESDSLKAYNMVALVEGADTRPRPVPTEAQWTTINAIKDSLRRIYPERADSINNGADDDGSGSVSVLEIAEAFATGPVKPKRSLIFIWQVGEEKGLWGSQWFTNHPTTMPRDSIIADLNLDMVGRGASTDVTGRAADSTFLHGADNYLQLVGSRRLSTELGDIVEQVNRDKEYGFTFDYAMDANGHPQNIYCRSDHANYARYGIPVVFFTTGGHADYHQLTDEPQYIQYQHMAKVDQLVFDIAVKVAGLDHRVVVDQQKPSSPFGNCQQ